MTPQQGYDAMADLYAEAVPTAYQYPVERHAVEAFAERVLTSGSMGVVVDVGCGTGHVAADLTSRGLDVIGIDPSVSMLGYARSAYPGVAFAEGDASLTALPDGTDIAAIIARFSLIHISPEQVMETLRIWAARTHPDTPVLVAAQASDAPGVPLPFDHAVAPAWRWHPDELSRVLDTNGFAEEWRIVYRDQSYRFPMVQLLTHRR
ncbi:class I SAM-dependent methyltransferase [Tsukamurella sp. 8F]|uniref:class I SAM-dependent DNA methyltransferase n=1 Tax=unclassified Tsukamurella TaxID=2633480 RepID=UPI0023B94489|nr:MULTISPECIES: class I SAM-dependent methyltransferase [unclassified Tsukamurella]MDF0530394.1 class I SAM-dependent methyltransferase [Tsukamurella sp. 8J]MDF0587785.1 class I SAM-dependent methyltransferase [Tsukamurella sp. 8F]